jgi:hypothetical protein
MLRGVAVPGILRRGPKPQARNLNRRNRKEKGRQQAPFS